MYISGCRICTFPYNRVVAVTITQFRQKLFQFADQALKGETVEFTHKGVVFKVVPETKKSKLSRLTAIEDIFPPGVDPDGDYRFDRSAQGNGSRVGKGLG